MKTELSICYLCSRGLVPAVYAIWFIAQSLECPPGSRVVEIVDLPVEFLISSGPSILPLPLPYGSNAWLWVSASVSVSCW